MKKIVVGSVIAMAAGAGMMAYALNNKNTKRKEKKHVNNTMNITNKRINSMK